MNKNEFLTHSLTQDFIAQLARLLSNTSGHFTHSYTTPKPKKTYTFSSVKDAYQQYFWGGDNYSQTFTQLSWLKRQLMQAIDRKDELQCLTAALKILEWGEVYRGSVGWLADKAQKGTLVQSISQARDILSGADDQALDAFGKDDSQLRSDSGMTKIYALSGANSVIYDDRVGAAMALLAKTYLTQNNTQYVPDTLAFMCKGSKSDKAGRNPSNALYKFPGKDSGYHHARSNLYTNWIIEAIANSPAFNWPTTNDQLHTKMQAIEAALFMIGYAVTGDKVHHSNIKLV